MKGSQLVSWRIGAFRRKADYIYEELKRLEKCNEENEELLSTLRLVAETLYGLKGENE